MRIDILKGKGEKEKIKANTFVAREQTILSIPVINYMVNPPKYKLITLRLLLLICKQTPLLQRWYKSLFRNIMSFYKIGCK